MPFFFFFLDWREKVQYGRVVGVGMLPHGVSQMVKMVCSASLPFFGSSAGAAVRKG